MKEKACANIEAAKLLVDNNFFDSAASRAYYAIYLIAWHTLDVLGVNPPDEARDGNQYWNHHSFPERLYEDYRLIGPHQIKKWERLYGLRIKADYYPDEITEEDAKAALISAYDFVNHFINEERRIE